MSAVEELEVTVTTQTAPSGPIDAQKYHRVASNTPEIHIVSELAWDGLTPLSKVLGAYFDHGTALSVAAMFGAKVTTVEIGAIPLPDVNPKDIH